MCNVLIEYDRCSRWLMSLISHLRWSLRLYLPYLSAVWNSPVTVSLFHIISPFPLHHILFLFLSSFPVCWSISRVFVPLSACCESSDCHFKHLFLFSSSSRSFWLVCRFPPLLSPLQIFPSFFSLFPRSLSVPVLLCSPGIHPIIIFILSLLGFSFIATSHLAFCRISHVGFWSHPTSSVHLSIHLFSSVISPHTLQLLPPFIPLPHGSTSHRSLHFPSSFQPVIVTMIF